ncbi:LOW QUALITY PROTEIN: DBIRD complex subunit ZNF326-like [Bombina bombina]|uniref:LOW QUALITY PROTEIN: DBIRD complex subunit ZNF326-like n=1 Tax=Bombina bombina TaxID=8345 RepID=UPI00235A68CE|nr:LOW QUALITY PROTEIN: DBIRD complex subunit ZNF326-like [Bombina bombina]
MASGLPAAVEALGRITDAFIDYKSSLYASRELDNFGGPSYARESSSDSKFSRFEPYESYDLRSSLVGQDLYRSGYGNSDLKRNSFGDGFGDRYENYWTRLHAFKGRNQGRSTWESPYSREALRNDYMDGRGRDDYSSYGRFSSPYNKPAAVGSLGIGMPGFPGSAFGSRSVAFGGPSPSRGRGKGQRGGYAIKAGAERGAKRKNVQPSKPAGNPVKKQKVVKSGLAKTTKKNSPQVKDEEEVSRLEARKEQQRRRREKYIEKYGVGYWMAFRCSFCKFRSFDEKGIEEHLNSDYHKEMLNHIQKQTKIDQTAVDFLHESIVNKYKKTAARQASQSGSASQVEKDVMEGITIEDHMLRVETVHCSACNIYVPALRISVQLHLKSSEHLKKKATYREQIKRSSILTATSIFNNPFVKTRYEMFYEVYLEESGENPFESQETDVTADMDAGAEGDVCVDTEDAEVAAEPLES